MKSIGKPFGFSGPLLLWNASGPSESKSETNTRTQDERLTTGAGGQVAVHDSTLSVGGAGASLSIVNSDADVAKEAIHGAENAASAAFASARDLTSASNALASQVADAPRLFTQKTILWAIGAVVLALLGFFYLRRK